MKTLFIVRHAKSSWEYPELKDHDRPLLPKGVKRTAKVAAYLRNKNIEPDVMISSSAVRAFETAVIVARELDYPLKDIIKEPNLYHANTSDILNHLFGLDNDLNSVMIFGHNPTFTSLVNKFLYKQVEWLPTSAIACVTFDTSKWEELMLAQTQTKFVIYPKMLK